MDSVEAMIRSLTNSEDIPDIDISTESLSIRIMKVYTALEMGPHTHVCMHETGLNGAGTSFDTYKFNLISSIKLTFRNLGICPCVCSGK